MGLQLDLQGIIILMWSATIPLIYYAFPYDSKLQAIYWSVVSFLHKVEIISTNIITSSVQLLLSARYSFFNLDLEIHHLHFCELRLLLLSPS